MQAKARKTDHEIQICQDSVKKIENIVLQAKESKKLSSSDEDIDMLVKELIASHTIG